MIDEGLRGFLLSFPPVVAIVGQRIYPAPLPLGSQLPAITYQDITELTSMSHSGPDSLHRVMYQISHWAGTRAAARSANQVTQSSLNGFRGEWPGNLCIGGVFHRDTRTVFEAETGLSRVDSDYLVCVYQ